MKAKHQASKSIEGISRSVMAAASGAKKAQRRRRRSAEKPGVCGLSKRENQPSLPRHQRHGVGVVKSQRRRRKNEIINMAGSLALKSGSENSIL
jgi:hypothetical protein